MNRRKFFQATATVAAGVGAGCPQILAATGPAKDGPVLGQGTFRYRVNRLWGQLDRAMAPVEDCHAITENRDGHIVLLNTDTRNNIIVYTRAGEFVSKRENRFPSAHALEFDRHANGEEVLWITDNRVPVVALCAPDGRVLRRIGPDAIAAVYREDEKYSPTNVAVMPDGDFFVSDGYGSDRILHFDPDWKRVSMFGGRGEAPENLRQPHAVWLDQREGAAKLLVCDRGNESLKWFSPAGELLRVVPVPGARPCNVVPFGDRHLVIPCLNGMLLVLDGRNRVISVIGGEPARYVGDTLQPLVAYNYVFNHPHDAYIDSGGDIYVAQWNSNRSYPLKLELEASAF